MTMMKNTVLMLGAVVALAFTAPALAADAPAAASAVKFGIVDMNRVMQTTDAAKDIFSQLESKRTEYQSQISKEEDSLRSAEQEIMKQKDTLSKEALESKRHEFEGKVLSGQKLVQDRKQTLDHAFNSSMSNLRVEAAKIVADVAKERGYAVVFTQDAVMISLPELDMTDVVIERMNKSVKKVSVDWSAPSAQGSAPKAGKKK